MGKTFRANGGIKLTKNGKSIELIFEVVRREEEWEERFAERMRMYQDFYENFMPQDSGYEKIPQLIFICEDEKHMVETFREIVKNKLELSKIKMYFSTDLRQNNDTLDKTLVEFKLDEATNKYKMEEPEIKLLGM